MLKGRQSTLNYRIGLLLAGATAFSTLAAADGLMIDKVYHPYVDAQQYELEYRSSFLDRARDARLRTQVHQLAFGRSLSEHFFGEVNLIGTGSDLEDISTEAVEAELKYQFGEQGEHSIDWGLLFDYEQGVRGNSNDAAIGVLGEKEFGRWSATLNLILEQEWGGDIQDEIETRAALQLRYRSSPLLEPTIELYAGQRGNGLGPVLQGGLRFGSGRTLHWEAGVILGLDDDTPRSTTRILLEYEF